MSDPIRGGGRPPIKPDLPRNVDETSSAEAKSVATPASPEAKEQGPVDKFERSVGAQLGNRLQALSGKAAAAKIQFSNEDIAYLATTFAAILNQNPQASRLKRARLFARAILKGKRLRKAFAGVPEQEMEQMCDVIGDVLDSSPVFGQLVDNVTDGASKLNG